MPSYTITEPHPTVRRDAYAHTGRGGAGNTFRGSAAPVLVAPTTATSTTPTTTAAASVTAAELYKHSSGSSIGSTSSAGGGACTRFYSGRGGAGNAHAASDARPAMSLDEEYARAEARERMRAPCHVGRGGAGNVSFVGSPSSSSRRAADTGSVRSKIRNLLR